MWPYITYTLIAGLLLPLIEWQRWKKSYGEVDNLNKRVTVAIAVIAWLLVCWAFKLFAWPVLLFGVCCLCIRGTLYDPVLNLFMNRAIDAESTTTNSKTDKIEQRNRLSFRVQRLLYFLAAVCFAIAYEIIK